MSTHVQGSQSFSVFFASFCIYQVSHQQHKGCIDISLFGTGCSGYFFSQVSSMTIIEMCPLHISNVVHAQSFGKAILVVFTLQAQAW